MPLTVDRSDQLPPLAWCASWQRHDTVVRLRCGRFVEVFDEAWVEGAWAEEFVRGPDPDVPLAGSGGLLGAEGLTLVPPFHTCEPLYFTFLHEEVVASNSLPFLLVEASLRLDPRHNGYALTLGRIIEGIDHHHVLLPTEQGVDVHVSRVKPASVSADHELTFGDPPQVSPFRDFHHYRSYLTGMLAAIASNASDPQRRQTFDLVTSVSSGYDSPACAVLGREVGCSRAVTLARARGAQDRSEVCDSGDPIARRLGLELAAVDRDPRLSADGEPVSTEFWATGHDPSDLIFRSLEPYLPAALFLTGFHGGTFWSRDANPNTVLAGSDLSGSSLGEFRLRVGFIHLPIPFLGALQHPSLHRISNSDEMRPWSIGGSYDRPIPRRIVEGAGIDRSQFGQRKKAVATFGYRAGIDDPIITEHLRSYVDERGIRRATRARHVALSVPYRLGRSPRAVMAPERFRGSRLLRGLIDRVPGLHTSVLKHAFFGREGPVPFIWACEQLMEQRYTRSA